MIVVWEIVRVSGSACMMACVKVCVYVCDGMCGEVW